MSRFSQHNQIKAKEWFAILAVAALFIAFQSWTWNYGTKVNDVSSIVSHTLSKDMSVGSALERKTVVGESRDGETIDKWVTRFKLYSVSADEAVNIMALARIKPHEGKFDPHFYQYGGAWLYPLGGWLFAAQKTGLLALGPLETMLDEPDRMDAVYAFGRAFVTIAVALAALPLFFALRMWTSFSVSILATAIFLFCPATIFYSLTLKPHWYALLWVNLAIYLVSRGFFKKQFSLSGEVFIGICVGFAVGSASTYVFFAIFLWLALIFAVRQGCAGIRSLFVVPLAAFASLVASNPFLFINWKAATSEAVTSTGQLRSIPEGGFVLEYLFQSIGRGLGVALLAFVLLIAVVSIARPIKPASRWLGLGLLATLAVGSLLTMATVSWKTNIRYTPYLVPFALLLLATVPMKGKAQALAVVLGLTILQMLPLKAAYWDENSADHSTRLQAAKWIDENIPAGARLCPPKITMAPFNTPPFDFAKFDLGFEDCVYRITKGDGQQIEVGWTVLKIFEPRFSPDVYPLVFEHINPVFTISKQGLE